MAAPATSSPETSLDGESGCGWLRDGHQNEEHGAGDLPRRSRGVTGAWKRGRGGEWRRKTPVLGGTSVLIDGLRLRIGGELLHVPTIAGNRLERIKGG